MIKQSHQAAPTGLLASSFYGFRSFNDMLKRCREARVAQSTADEKSGGYTVRVARPTGAARRRSSLRSRASLKPADCSAVLILSTLRPPTLQECSRPISSTSPNANASASINPAKNDKKGPLDNVAADLDLAQGDHHDEVMIT